MSYEAIQWAQGVSVGRSSAKFVLISLARFAAPENQFKCFASIENLVDFTEMNRKTVIAAIQFLITSGIILDTKERGGVTKKMPVYQLNLGLKKGSDAVEVVPKLVLLKGGNGVDGSVAKHADAAEIVPFLPINSPVLGGNDTKNGTVKQSQNCQNSPEIVPFLPINSPVFSGNSPVFSDKQSQNWDTNKKELEKNSVVNTQRHGAENRYGELADVLRGCGLVVSNGNSLLKKLVDDEIAIETILAAVEQARVSLRGDAVTLAYVVGVLNRWNQQIKGLDLRGVAPPAGGGAKFDPVAFNNRNRSA